MGLVRPEVRRTRAAGQARTRALVGSYIGRSDTSAANRSPAMSTSHEPASSHSLVTGSAALTKASPTAAPSVQPYDAART